MYYALSATLTGLVHYKATALSSTTHLVVNAIDANGQTVQYDKGLEGVMVLPNVHLWWPFTMSDSPAYLYTLKVV